ncbi:unnamed protein product [Periconia digitata]|uniref:F-box domain-containing protein n=1 Tax=Periconia digitata TaxID=1303443 RepID=A0A9W4UGY5_9PLEO|nr:unnamed protein product [Periconia digitata]
MDDLLPSYESAIEQNPWELVAPYLNSQSLCTASLVCQKWHEVFTPHLWGAPASHFGVQNDTVYVALTRFKRTLHWSRVSVRELTHTLHLPPAHAEIYGGPHYEWLRDCLERLPRLQCLIVDGLPFFNHACLLTLRHSSSWWRQTHPNAYPVFGLRLLDASGCSNATPTGLADALPHFPDLVSLDLSKTLAAKDSSVFSQLSHLRNLRVLKLRGLGLRDTDLANIASAIGVRVRSLDVTDNQLTDTSARILLENCIKEVRVHQELSRVSSPRSPVPFDRPRDEVGDASTENLDGHLRNKLTKGFIGSLAIEKARDVGITHLYLSSNNMTVEGISGILRSGRLQVLDFGTLPSFLASPHHSLPEGHDGLLLPGVEKLTPVLAHYAGHNLVYLRANYTIITKDCAMNAPLSPRAKLDAREKTITDPPQAELASDGPAIHELPGDYTHPIELPSIVAGGSDKKNRTSTPTIELTPDIITNTNCGVSVFSSQNETTSSLSPTLDATGGLSPQSVILEDKVLARSIDEAEEKLVVESPPRDSMTFAEDRRARLDMRQSEENRLHPNMLPKVHTLVLTEVPNQTHDAEVVSRLIQFIKDCAEEDGIARLRAKHTYMLPPGRNRKTGELEYAKTIFALRRIVLEVAVPQSTPKKITSSWRAYPTKSSTEDTDSEAFWEAATYDFSFFSDDECGLPTLEPGRGPPLTAMSGLMLDTRQSAAPPSQMRQPEPRFKPAIDVIGEIGKFRRERKAAYDAAFQSSSSESEPSVEGHWPGIITVVRKQMNTDAGILDYYGNKFEAGYLYR